MGLGGHEGTGALEAGWAMVGSAVALMSSRRPRMPGAGTGTDLGVRKRAATALDLGAAGC